MNITIKVKSVTCPNCGAEEEHPNGKHILIRAFKVDMGDGHWWSQCLVCAGFYLPDLTENPDKTKFNREEGWF